MRSNVGYIYLITLSASGLQYIGVTRRTIGQRLRDHLSDARRHLYHSLLNNEFKVRKLKKIRYTKKIELFRLERFFINKLKPKLNRR